MPPGPVLNLQNKKLKEEITELKFKLGQYKMQPRPLCSPRKRERDNNSPNVY